MTLSEVLRGIKTQLENEKKTIASDMVNGRMTDFNSYHKNVGVAKGLDEAQIIIDEMIKKLNEEDE